MLKKRPKRKYQCHKCGKVFAKRDVMAIAGNWLCYDCGAPMLLRILAAAIRGEF